ncbi:hypothetical protein [Roseibium suaedae]|uniref:Uncharacterized protein n=1 Tax=Roseibium suaedae TaxID=735517 RepID=A0A1M7NXI0_9HYPH|nr:hypothetical protein [Roseibium suaedae]SHN08749.1 hypothetical protein SAMN05444272_4032 [Roseibium suaedae]
MTEHSDRIKGGDRAGAAQKIAADQALLRRLSNVLQDMGLPCACQDEVERTLAVFEEFEIRRSRKRLIIAARKHADVLCAALPYLQDVHHLEEPDMHPDDVTALVETFRHISETASQAAANLEILSGLNHSEPAGKT